MVKSLLTECGIELSTTSDEAAKFFDATIAQTVLKDTDQQGSCSVLVLPNNIDISRHDFLRKMGTTGHNTKCDSSHDIPTLADWRNWTSLKEDDGGGPRLPHGESVPPHE